MGIAERVKNLSTQIGVKDVIAATIGVGMTATACYLACAGKSIPGELWASITLILGYYFGQVNSKKG